MAPTKYGSYFRVKNLSCGVLTIIQITMNIENNTSEKRKARIAGFIYLVVVLTGMFSLGYVPSKIYVADDISLTLKNIAAAEWLYRLGIFAELLCYIAFLFLPLALYQLLRSVHTTYASVMVILVVVCVPISFMNVVNKIALLDLATNETTQHLFTPNEISQQGWILLQKYVFGNRVAQVFWGLWLFPFGYLVVKSGFLPKFIGVLLMVGAVGYVVNVIGHTLIPYYSSSGFSSIVRIPASLGEIGICLWLIIVGVKQKQIRPSN